MSAIILAGGSNLNIKPLSPHESKLKPLVRFGNKCLLDLQLDWLGKNGFDDITVATTKQVLDSYIPETKVKYQELIDDNPLGTAGAVKEALKQSNTDYDYVYVLNVNSLVFYSIKPMMDLADPCSILLGKPRSSWGEVEISGETISIFEEKPLNTRYVSLGHYAFHKPLAKTFPEKGSLEREVLPLLANFGLVKGYRFNSDVYHFTSYEEYLAVKERLEVNKKR
jgi:NDP-sugar pyrophosphorylase family protein